VREAQTLRVQQESGVAGEGRATAGQGPTAAGRDASFGVERFADQRVTRGGEVDPDLVRPSRRGGDLDEGGAGAPLQHANLAVRLLAQG